MMPVIWSVCGETRRADEQKVMGGLIFHHEWRINQMASQSIPAGFRAVSLVFAYSVCRHRIEVQALAASLSRARST